MARIDSIDDAVQRVIEEAPILNDKNFQDKNPGIVKVAGIIDFVAQMFIEANGSYGLYDELRINNISQYIDLIKQEDIQALRTYQRLRDALHLG